MPIVNGGLTTSQESDRQHRQRRLRCKARKRKAKRVFVYLCLQVCTGSSILQPAAGATRAEPPSCRAQRQSCCSPAAARATLRPISACHRQFDERCDCPPSQPAPVTAHQVAQRVTAASTCQAVLEALPPPAATSHSLSSGSGDNGSIGRTQRRQCIVPRRRFVHPESAHSPPLARRHALGEPRRYSSSSMRQQRRRKREQNRTLRCLRSALLGGLPQASNVAADGGSGGGAAVGEKKGDTRSRLQAFQVRRYSAAQEHHYPIGSNSRQHVGAASLHLLAVAAVPDADSLPLHGILAAERARVLGVLRDLNLLDDLTQRGTVTGAVLAGDPDLLRAALQPR